MAIFDLRVTLAVVLLAAGGGPVAGALAPLGEDLDMAEWDRRGRASPDDGQVGDRFGADVALDGSLGLVGAPAQDTADGDEAGAVYVLDVDQAGSIETRLRAPDAASGDRFGAAVAMTDGRAVVGAPNADTSEAEDAGAAHVFVRTDEGWTQRAKLSAEDGAGGDSFGAAVATAGDRVLVGAPNAATAAGAEAGAAYVFQLAEAGPQQEARLTHEGASAIDHLGASVALEARQGIAEPATALVGAPLADPDGNADSYYDDRSGAAYVFEATDDGWAEQANLAPSDATGTDRFGRSVDLDQGTAVVGAPFHDIGIHDNRGAAYVFERVGPAWVDEEAAKLTASDGLNWDRFGWSVAVSGERALAGAYRAGTSAPGHNTGTAYVFHGAGPVWNEEAKLLPNAGVLWAYFGWSVDLEQPPLSDEATALVGANHHPAFSSEPGAAYVFGSRPDGPV